MFPLYKTEQINGSATLGSIIIFMSDHLLAPIAFDELTFDDIKLEDYESHPVIKFEVAV